MSSVIGNVLVSVETEAGSLLEDEDNCIIPVNQAPADEHALKSGPEPAESFGGTRLELCYISFTRSESSSGNPGRNMAALFMAAFTVFVSDSRSA